MICRSCLTENVPKINMKGRLCIDCIKKSGRFLRNTDEQYLKELLEVGIVTDVTFYS